MLNLYQCPQLKLDILLWTHEMLFKCHLTSRSGPSEGHWIADSMLLIWWRKACEAMHICKFFMHNAHSCVRNHMHVLIWTCMHSITSKQKNVHLFPVNCNPFHFIDIHKDNAFCVWFFILLMRLKHNSSTDEISNIKRLFRWCGSLRALCFMEDKETVFNKHFSNRHRKSTVALG